MGGEIVTLTDILPQVKDKDMVAVDDKLPIAAADGSHAAVADIGPPEESPFDFGSAAFQKGEAVGIEKRAAIRRETHRLVLHTTMNGPKCRQQAAPGVVSPLQNLLAGMIGSLAELSA